MGSPGASGSDRELIVRTVAEADRRLRAARYVRDLVVGSALILHLALLIQIIAHVLPISPAIPLWVAALGIPALAAWRAWVLARRRSLARAAAVLDRRASLRDELVSAHWFAGLHARARGAFASPLELHAHRAAGTVAALDLAELLPVALPRRAAAAGVAVLATLIVATLVPVDWTRAWVRGVATAGLTDTERDQLELIGRALASDAPQSPERAALKARIDELLRKLGEGDLSPEETLALVDELRQLIGAVASGADARAALARAGEALAGADAAEGVGDALRGGKLDEAARRMRELAANIEEAMQGGAAPGLQAALTRAAAESRGSLDRLAGDLAEAATELGRRKAEAAQAALDRAAGEIEAVAEGQEFEESLRNASGQLDDLMKSLGSRFGSPRQAGQAAQSGERQMFPSSDMNPEGARQMPGEGPGRPVAGSAQELQGGMVASADQPGSSAPGPLGAPSIAAAGAPATIDVTRRREVLPVEPPAGEEPRERLKDEETRATRAMVEYRPVESVPPYAEADRLTPTGVPWPYRDLVKSYFRLIGPRGTKETGGRR